MMRVLRGRLTGDSPWWPNHPFRYPIPEDGQRPARGPGDRGVDTRKIILRHVMAGVPKLKF